MNNTLSKFAREELNKNLMKCSNEQQFLFKRMYSHENLSAHIEDVVNNIPDEKLDWAMSQVERTLQNNALKQCGALKVKE